MANMATGKMMKETFLFLSLKPCSFHVRDYWFVGIKIAWNNFQFYFLKLQWHQMRKLFKGLIFPWNALTQPMANRLKLLGIPYLIGKISRLNFYFMVRNGRVRKKIDIHNDAVFETKSNIFQTWPSSFWGVHRPSKTLLSWVCRNPFLGGCS